MKAFLFDLNGTMINDMHYHLDVWFDVLNNDLGANLTREQVRSQMYGKNDELLERVFGRGKFTPEKMAAISQLKEEKYQALYKPHLDLLPGLFDLLERASKAGVGMAIASAAIPFNIDFVLDNLNIRKYFKAIVSAYDVAESKPHPEVFQKAAALLGAAPDDCIVFEDAPKGVEAAMRANMNAVVLTTMHSKDEFAAYNNVIVFAEDYKDEKVGKLVG